MNRLLLSSIIIITFSLQIVAGTTSSVPGGIGSATRTPIKHVVIIMMENHSFDNIFGLYPTLNLTDPGPLLSSIKTPADVLNASRSIASSLVAIPNGTYSTADPNEAVYQQDWDNGKMDGFALNSGEPAMTYYGPSQFGIEWDWAEEYAIGDRYFSSCLCETDPNRLFSLAGYANNQTQDFNPPPYLPANQTIFGELNHYGISWDYYIQNPAVNNGFNPLNYFTGNSTISSQVRSWTDFNTSLTDGTLSSVSWVMPVGGGAEGVDEHPNSNVTIGELWLLEIVDSVMKSPYWDSTVIFINYDEGGGYYDQIPPPLVDGVQLGFRVPFFVISPFAKENYFSNTLMNHGSTLAFIDYNWRLPALNQFVADSGLPLDMFNFIGADARTPVILNSSSTFPATPQLPFNQLIYSREGSTNETLALLGSGLYEPNSTSLVLNESVLLLTVGAGLLVVTLFITIRYRTRSSRHF